MAIASIWRALVVAALAAAVFAACDEDPVRAPTPTVTADPGGDSRFHRPANPLANPLANPSAHPGEDAHPRPNSYAISHAQPSRHSNPKPQPHALPDPR